ncbi:GntR family transcriptional regulator [Brevibacillus ginsengisoli]|uniref:GntR family transcriptional regulator n=1 Tax=Brevibacillus ginsengisoli TaxID=363854 RepID=UPI003CE6D43A
MMIKGSSRSLSLLVMDRIKEDIEAGRLQSGERLPSEAELSKRLGVSRATLREALRLLEEEKIVVRKHGVGTFIHPRPVFSGGIGELFSVTGAIERQGQQAGTILLHTDLVDPCEEDRKRLHLRPDEKLLNVVRVRTANGEPVVYCVDKIPASLMPDGYHLECESIFEALEEMSGIHIAYAVADIEPIGYHEQVSSILKCDAKTAILLLRQVHYDDMERAVLYSRNYFRADKFHFQVVRRRLT